MSEKSNACGCGCGPSATSTTTVAAKGESTTAVADIRTKVREKYGSIAEGATSGCCGGDASEAMTQIGYDDAQTKAIPEGSNLGLGCGNPLAYADVQKGETVLDLGSGAGVDCFLAANQVGPTGRVIGVDMTPSMIEKARDNAEKGEYPNVEFRLGEIERLPVADASVDLIISNCVINLSPDKPQVFREALRALKPGGRVLVSDLVLTKPLPKELEQSVELYVGCVAGASLKSSYLALMREAGFTDVEIVNENRYTVGEVDAASGSPEQQAFNYVTSVKVRATKPSA